MGVIIYTERIGGYLEEEHVGRSGERIIRIWDSWRISDIKKEFERGDEKSVKVAKLKKVEQGGKTIEEFMQEFQRVARGSGYEERPLMEEFKRRINGVIRRKLMEVERPPTSIEQ